MGREAPQNTILHFQISWGTFIAKLQIVLSSFSIEAIENMVRFLLFLEWEVGGVLMVFVTLWSYFSVNKKNKKKHFLLLCKWHIQFAYIKVPFCRDRFTVYISTCRYKVLDLQYETPCGTLDLSRPDIFVWQAQKLHMEALIDMW